MVCAACLAAPLAIMGIGSIYFNTVLGLLLTLFFSAFYIVSVSRKNCKLCNA
jgi:hypothetical protein